MESSTPTMAQLRAIMILPTVTGTISLVGSVAIICIIFRSHVKLSTTYHRILFGLACSDVIGSISNALSSYPVPRDSGILYASGNQTTCNIQGFMSTLGHASLIFYYCGLSCYFVLTIKTKLSDEQICKYYEPLVHIISILFPLLTACVFSIHNGGFYTSGANCWVAPRPLHCDKDPDVECETGNDFIIVRAIIFAWPTVIGIVLISTNMLIIFWSLYSQNKSPHISSGNPGYDDNNDDDDDECHAHDHHIDPEEMNENSPDDDELYFTSNRTNRRRKSFIELYEETKKNRKSSKAHRDRIEGMIQALLYVFAFIITHIFPFIYHVSYGLGKQVSINILIISKILYPSQGFFNFFVYIRPSVVNAKRRDPTLTTWEALKKAAQSRGEKESTRRRSSLLLSRFLSAKDGINTSDDMKHNSSRLQKRLSEVVAMKNTNERNFTREDDVEDASIEDGL